MSRLHEVAKLAGVSPSTVSRALSRPEMVSEGTRARVEEAVRRLKYRPSRVARRLRVERGLSGLVGLVIPDLQNPFFAELARGAEDVAQARGYTVLIGNADEDLEKETRYLEVMRSESVDGIMLPPSSGVNSAAIEMWREGMPLVCVDRRIAGVDVDTVVVDNARGAYDAVAHLIGLGHRRIGFLEGIPGISTSRERLQGYRAALGDHGIEAGRELTRSGDSRRESGRRLGEDLLGQPDRPHALLVGNGMMTLGVLEAIRGLGLRIPEDIAVVGYDDMPWAPVLTPPLTVVRQPGYELGSRAMELLLGRIADPGRSTTAISLQPELVVRGSCGASLADRR
jgi:DNA-binding LacI/PurR family transcriptional regulator